MSLSTIYLIAISIVPAALGAALLTLVSIDQLHNDPGQSQPPAAEGLSKRYQPYRTKSADPLSPGLPALFHQGAIQ